MKELRKLNYSPRDIDDAVNRITSALPDIFLDYQEVINELIVRVRRLEKEQGE